MKRIVALAVMFLFGIAGIAHAQDFRIATKIPTKSAAPASEKSVSTFSKASLDKAVAGIAKAAPAPRLGSRAFWRGPWPYLIGAGIVVGLIIAFGGSSLGGPVPY